MNHFSAFWTRLFALTRKESKQLLRDKSSMAIGFILPIILILLFGYGLSFDLTNGRVGVVEQQSTPQSQQLMSGLNGSRYITVKYYPSFSQAEAAMGKAEIDAIVNIPSNFAEQYAKGAGAVQVITNGRSTSIASALQGYITSALNTASLIQADRTNAASVGGIITVEQRMWFNESANSTWFLVPGLIVLILTLVGAFLTGLLIARERERGTLEALYVTPVRPLEIVLSKLAPYIVIGMIDIVMCLVAAHVLFDVPIRASLFSVMSASFLYLMVSLLLGLMISGLSKSQFQASQMALLASFMPALMLSGFVFDTRNLPLIVQIISNVLPATHYMTLIKTLLLGGDDWSLWFKECGILLIYIVLFTVMTARTLKKRLG